MLLVGVALDVSVDDLFDFLLSDSQQVRLGQRVFVPVGRGKCAGTVMEVGGETAPGESHMKRAENLLQDEPPQDAEVLDLVEVATLRMPPLALPALQPPLAQCLPSM